MVSIKIHIIRVFAGLLILVIMNFSTQGETLTPEIFGFGKLIMFITGYVFLMTAVDLTLISKD